MKTTFIALSVLSLAACSSNPSHAPINNTPIQGYQGLQQLSQEQVIQKTHKCVEAKMRPSIEYISQQYSNGSVEVPVQVNCYPAWRQ